MNRSFSIFFLFSYIALFIGCSHQPKTISYQKEKKDFSFPIKVFFETGKYDLNSDTNAFRDLVSYLKKNHQQKIIIEGHADERGSESYNLKLGDYRARSVFKELVDLGVSPDQILIISYGESKSTSSGSHELKLNRRVEIKKRI